MKRFLKITLYCVMAVGITISGIFVIRALNNRGNAPFIHLKMDEGYGTTTYDSSGNNNDGTLNGNTAWKNEEDCASGKCLYFDGSGDYVSVPDFDLE